MYLFLAAACLVFWLYWSYRIWKNEGFVVLVKYNFYMVPGALATAFIEIHRGNF